MPWFNNSTYLKIIDSMAIIIAKLKARGIDGQDATSKWLHLHGDNGFKKGKLTSELFQHIAYDVQQRPARHR